MEPAALLSAIRRALQAILGGNLVGIYVHGSIAFGCFRWDRSDVDFIAVVDRPIRREQARALLAALLALNEQAPPKGIEMSVVLRAHCRCFVHPVPFELHFSSSWLDVCRADPDSLFHDERQCDPDLAAHFAVIRSVGVALCGPEAGDVFGPVPAEDYFDSIWEDVRGAREDIADNPVYVALNLCRTLAQVRDGLVLSKRGGGEWALLHVAPAHHPLIRAALIDYAGGASMAIAPDAMAAFAAYMLAAIKNQESELP